MMTTANAGTRVAAGVSSRCLGLAAQVFETLHEGSVVQVESGNSLASADVFCPEGGNTLLLQRAGQGSPEPFELG